MAVPAKELMKKKYMEMKASGDKLLASDATLVIEGHEDSWMHLLSFPQPVLSNGEVAETYVPATGKIHQVFP